jgi:hypothetical protein
MRKKTRKVVGEIHFRFAARKTKVEAGMRKGSKKEKGEQERRRRRGMRKAKRKEKRGA